MHAPGPYPFFSFQRGRVLLRTAHILQSMIHNMWGGGAIYRILGRKQPSEESGATESVSPASALSLDIHFAYLCILT